ncbi:MAG: ABC transporter ATP-binding protein [Bacteroidetes bacterium]|nr:ABC transporter ATP-binding protein [Bacteroidota bacterium]MDA1337011.1 ABC transporter ATP-binding protein [Bacteroidota bacterium]
MIRARGIQKAFGDVEVLKGIDLDIPKNEITAITGASGAGKTTLLQILGTLHSPDNGELSIGDRPVHLLKGKELAQFRNRKIGFIFQFHRLLPEFNALENVLMPAWILGNDGAKEKDRAKRLLKDLGLGDRMTHAPNQLSGGEQQRVAAARALMNQPDVVLADEPTGNLDSGNADSLFELFEELRDREGQTFVVVTHNQSMAQRGNNTLRLADGRLIE